MDLCLVDNTKLLTARVTRCIPITHYSASAVSTTRGIACAFLIATEGTCQDMITRNECADTFMIITQTNEPNHPRWTRLTVTNNMTRE